MVNQGNKFMTNYMTQMTQKTGFVMNLWQYMTNCILVQQVIANQPSQAGW